MFTEYHLKYIFTDQRSKFNVYKCQKNLKIKYG